MMGACMCKKCGKLCSVLVLLFGLGFLLQDLGRWSFWGLNWYTVVFLLLGLGSLASYGCKDCQACCGGCCEAPAPAKKKK